MTELDPSLDQDKIVRKKTAGPVMKEIPKRLAVLPAWKYRGYRSMLSNGDSGKSSEPGAISSHRVPQAWAPAREHEFYPSIASPYSH